MTPFNQIRKVEDENNCDLQAMKSHVRRAWSSRKSYTETLRRKTD